MVNNNGEYQVLVGARPEEFQQWERLCQGLPLTDVYFLPQYSLIFERLGHGVAHCFVYRSAHGLVLYPFLLRRINDLQLFQSEEQMWDITSPYGYGGPLFCPIGETPSPELVAGFHRAFESYCQGNQIVSEFARLHPLMRNHEAVGPWTVFQQNTIYLSLTQSHESLWNGLRENHRRNIKKAMRLGVEISWDTRGEHLEQFYTLYVETMRRRQAASFYFFPMEFFRSTLDLLGDSAFLGVARFQGRVVAGALFLRHNGFLHYHFGGSQEESLELGANHLLFYQAAVWGQEHGSRYFHLGGGLKPDDSLYLFKAGFSKQTAPFYTLRRVHNPNTYNRLTVLRQDYERANGVQGDDGFFPRYRGLD